MSAAARQPKAIVRVAVPVPVRRVFDYRPRDGEPPVRGARVRVSFGRRTLVGIVVEAVDASVPPAARLKELDRVLDDESVFGETLTELLSWSAAYYHFPLGEVFHAALPGPLRRGRALAPAATAAFRVSESGRRLGADALKRAPAQRALLAELATREEITAEELTARGDAVRRALRLLERKGWVCRRAASVAGAAAGGGEPGPQLSPHQRNACAQVCASLSGFRVFLLHGVTGSGKTEVYLHVVAQALRCGTQALVLVPEIALTPQLVRRFRTRLGVTIAVLHSGLSESERHRAWWQARSGAAAVVLGTRSAVFAPVRRLGVVVVDEEHDPSYKQQDGFRYHARDVAIKRARMLGVPVVLGSATPSLETLANVHGARYTLLELPARTGSALLPSVHLLDVKRLALRDGLSPPLLEAMERHLARGEQCLIFLNRRGFAPVVMCQGCGWQAQCRRCDARLTLHRRSERLRCHHCGANLAVPAQCPECGAQKLYRGGAGTQRVEEALAKRFPTAQLVRIDSDTTARKGALQEQLSRVEDGRADILIGTQMLSKGHDFPGVTLVGIVNVDQGLYSLDFRAPEHLFQQVMQVAGRAGRGDKPGVVYIQTLHPENPYFVQIARHDYGRLAAIALRERRQADYPPFTHMALLRAESARPGAALAYLRCAHRLGAGLQRQRAAVSLMDPVPSPMERRAGRYRAQLLVRAPQRRELHAFLDEWMQCLDAEPRSRTVRWSLDVDPLEMY